MRAASYFFIVLFGLALLGACKNLSGDKALINGTITHLANTRLYIYQVLPGSDRLLDSVSTDSGGNFSISFPVKEAGFYALRQNPRDEITLVVSPGEKLILSGDGAALQKNYTIKGSAESELFAEYSRFTQSNLEKVDSLSSVFAESHNNPDFAGIKSRLDSAYLGIFNNQKEKVIHFVDTHSNSLAALLVISGNFGPNPLVSEQTQPELFLKLDSALSISYPHNSLVVPFHARMIDIRAQLADIREHDKTLKPGLPAPEISLPDAKGKEIKLSSLRGKLTLVYFWSSWDARSRQTNMNLAAIYSLYHSRGFEIYAVSVDSDTDLWQKAYALDRAQWIQLIDPKGLASAYCKTYGIRAIPKMILVAKDGTIVCHDPGLSELDALVKSNL